MHTMKTKFYYLLIVIGLFSCQEDSQDSTQNNHSEIISDMMDSPAMPEEFVEVRMHPLPIFAISNDSDKDSYLLFHVDQIKLLPRYQIDNVIRMGMTFNVVDAFDKRLYTVNDEEISFEPSLDTTQFIGDFDISIPFNKNSLNYEDIMKLNGRIDVHISTDIKFVMFEDSTVIKDSY